MTDKVVTIGALLELPICGPWRRDTGKLQRAAQRWPKDCTILWIVENGSAPEMDRVSLAIQWLCHHNRGVVDAFVEGLRGGRPFEARRMVYRLMPPECAHEAYRAAFRAASASELSWPEMLQKLSTHLRNDSSAEGATG